MDRGKAERAVADYLEALGYSLTGELDGTPARVVEAWTNELIAGESVDVHAALREGRIALEGEPTLVTLRDLRVATMCPHHLLPAHGYATVAYVPSRYVVGLGVISQLVDACSRRLILQEQIGDKIVQALLQELEAEGAAVVLRLYHTCLSLRGERENQATVETIATGGSLAPGKAHSELLAALISAPIAAAKGHP